MEGPVRIVVIMLMVLGLTYTCLVVYLSLFCPPRRTRRLQRRRARPAGARPGPRTVTDPPPMMTCPGGGEGVLVARWCTELGIPHEPHRRPQPMPPIPLRTPMFDTIGESKRARRKREAREWNTPSEDFVPPRMSLDPPSDPPGYLDERYEWERIWTFGGDSWWERGLCRHLAEYIEPVESVTGEVVAYLCTVCNQQIGRTV